MIIPDHNTSLIPLYCNAQLDCLSDRVIPLLFRVQHIGFSIGLDYGRDICMGMNFVKFEIKSAYGPHKQQNKICIITFWQTCCYTLFRSRTVDIQAMYCVRMLWYLHEMYRVPSSWNKIIVLNHFACNLLKGPRLNDITPGSCPNISTLCCLTHFLLYFILFGYARCLIRS